MDNYKIFEIEDKGYLKSLFVNDIEELELIKDNVDMNSDFREFFIDGVFEYIEKNNLSVSMITDFRVYLESQGQGIGSRLINEYKEKIMNKSDIDILIARTNNQQKDGFVLEEFYKRYGFESLDYSDGDILMVSKKHCIKLERELKLDNFRKKALKWFKENGVDANQQNYYNFLIKKEKDSQKNRKKHKI